MLGIPAIGPPLFGRVIDTQNPPSIITLPKNDGPTAAKPRELHSQPASEGDYNDMDGGWSWVLDSLKSYLETG
ncbi:MAG: hypothetical protein AB1649_33955, partial [Chloroflexota bacterium]